MSKNRNTDLLNLVLGVGTKYLYRDLDDAYAMLKNAAKAFTLDFNVEPIEGFSIVPRFHNEEVVLAYDQYYPKNNHMMAIYGYDFIEHKPSEKKLNNCLTNIKDKISNYCGIDFSETLVTKYQTFAIKPHIDKKIFGDTIAVLTINGGALIVFEPVNQTDRCYCKFVSQGDLYTITGKARYEYAHGVYMSTHRIAVSFRTLIPEHIKETKEQNQSKKLNKKKGIISKLFS